MYLRDSNRYLCFATRNEVRCTSLDGSRLLAVHEVEKSTNVTSIAIVRNSTLSALSAGKQVHSLVYCNGSALFAVPLVLPLPLQSTSTSSASPPSSAAVGRTFSANSSGVVTLVPLRNIHCERGYGLVDGVIYFFLPYDLLNYYLIIIFILDSSWISFLKRNISLSL